MIGWHTGALGKLVFFVGLGVTYLVYRNVPQAFIPEEDPGYFIVQIQAPPGASLEYTGGVARQAEQIIMKDPDVLAVFSVMGFSLDDLVSWGGEVRYDRGMPWQRLGGIACDRRFHSVLAEKLREQPGQLAVVLDEQRPDHHSPSGGGGPPNPACW